MYGYPDFPLWETTMQKMNPYAKTLTFQTVRLQDSCLFQWEAKNNERDSTRLLPIANHVIWLSAVSFLYSCEWRHLISKQHQIMVCQIHTSCFLKSTSLHFKAEITFSRLLLCLPWHISKWTPTRPSMWHYPNDSDISVDYWWNIGGAETGKNHQKTSIHPSSKTLTSEGISHASLRNPSSGSAPVVVLLASCSC